ncbi:GFA family protein [Kordiimonas laminariae]|uniref:GFA family protein n=1 Tax=Kordiimonas laminariae TaxID=2917717 RepID=UPI001FF6EC24|nr:GFA family protein [Kordiimonas laminariae]MCK0069195.1 GFA family protein [Kordiimonas laminariae]
MNKVTHKGGCHCGAVQFEVDAPADISALSCTCSMCSQTGFLHLFATKEEFRLLKGEERLTEYRFNTQTARHLFCSKCGVKSFYVPRSHPDGWSINVNCIDRSTISSLKVSEFDGANWEQNVEDIR